MWRYSWRHCSGLAEKRPGASSSSGRALAPAPATGAAARRRHLLTSLIGRIIRLQMSSPVRNNKQMVVASASDAALLPQAQCASAETNYLWYHLWYYRCCGVAAVRSSPNFLFSPRAKTPAGCTQNGKIAYRCTMRVRRKIGRRQQQVLLADVATTTEQLKKRVEFDASTGGDRGDHPCGGCCRSASGSRPLRTQGRHTVRHGSAIEVHGDSRAHFEVYDAQPAHQCGRS